MLEHNNWFAEPEPTARLKVGCAALTTICIDCELFGELQS